MDRHLISLVLIGLAFIAITPQAYAMHWASFALNQTAVSGTGVHTLSVDITNNESSGANITKFNISVGNFSASDIYFSGYSGMGDISCGTGHAFREMATLNCTYNATGFGAYWNVTFTVEINFTAYHEDYNVTLFTWDNGTGMNETYFNISVNDAIGPEINASSWVLSWGIPAENESATHEEANAIFNSMNISVQVTDIGYGVQNVTLGILNASGAYLQNISLWNATTDTTDALWQAHFPISLPDGNYTFALAANDSYGNGGYKNWTMLYFDNGIPSVAISSPAENGTVSGIFAWISFTVNDSNLNNGTIGLSYMEGSEVNVSGSCAKGAASGDLGNITCSYLWNTSLVAPGPYNITITAYDIAGREGTETVLNVTVPAAPNATVSVEDGSTDPGSFSHPITIWNNGNVRYNVTMYINSTNDWQLSLSNTTLDLEINESRTAYVTGTLPRSMEPGNATNVTINATYWRGTPANKLGISYDASKNSTSFNMTMLESFNVSLSASAGYFKTFYIPNRRNLLNMTLNIRNEGNGNEAFNITLQNGSYVFAGVNETSVWLNRTNCNYPGNVTNRTVTLYFNISPDFSGNRTVNITVASATNRSYNSTVSITFYYPRLNFTYTGPTTAKVKAVYYTGNLSDSADRARLWAFFRAKPNTGSFVEYADLLNGSMESNCTLWSLSRGASSSSKVYKNGTSAATSFKCVFNASELGLDEGGYHNITIMLTDKHNRTGTYTYSQVPVPKNSSVYIGSTSMDDGSAYEYADFDATVSPIRYYGITSAGFWGSLRVYYDDIDDDQMACGPDTISNANSHTFTDCSIDAAATYNALAYAKGVWGLTGTDTTSDEFVIEEDDDDDGDTGTGSGTGAAASQETSMPTTVAGMSLIGSSRFVAEEGIKKTMTLTIYNELDSGKSVYLFFDKEFEVVDLQRYGKAFVSVQPGGSREVKLNYTLRSHARPGNYTVTVRGTNNVQSSLFFEKELNFEVRAAAWGTSRAEVRRYMLDKSGNASTTVYLWAHNPFPGKRRITIRETVPKSVAEDASFITYGDYEPTIIDSDPVLEWTVDADAGETVEIDYTVNYVASKSEFAAQEPSIIGVEILASEAAESCGGECPDGYIFDDSCECIFKCVDAVCGEGQTLNLEDCTCQDAAVAAGLAEMSLGGDSIYIAGGVVGFVAVIALALYFLKRALFYEMLGKATGSLSGIVDKARGIGGKKFAISGPSMPSVNAPSIKAPKLAMPKFLKKRERHMKKVVTKSGKVLATYEAEDRKGKTIFTYDVKRDKKTGRGKMDDYQVI